MYKLLALDLDGTLLNDDEKISQRNAQAIRQLVAQGTHVCIATGRGYPSAVPFAKQLELDTPLVTVNGAEIWATPTSIYRRTLLDADYVRQLHQFARSLEDCWFWAYTTEGIYNLAGWIEPADDYDSHQWLKFGFYTENTQLLHQIYTKLCEWPELEITNSSPYNWEVNATGVSKATAIEQLCTLLNVTMAEVVVMGDSLNDIAMIKAAGLGVAVGNAQDAVKEVADVVVVDNNDHAVAYVIEHYFLRGK